MKRRAIIGLVAAVALTAASAAFGAVAQRPMLAHAAKANSQTFTVSDPTDDSGSAYPDIASVTVSNDDNGLITFQINLGNRQALSGQDGILVLLDSDQNGATGAQPLGLEYGLGIGPGNGVGLAQWNGSSFVAASPSTLTASSTSGQVTVSINKSDLGGTSGFNFGVVTTADGFNSSDSDIAPDTGPLWSYQVTISQPTGGSTGSTGSSGTPTVKLTAGKAEVTPAVHGKPFTASMTVTDASTGTGVSGTVTCSAKLGGKVLPGARHTASATGKASCTWKLPKTAKGKALTGKITVTYQGKTITRAFTARVK
jgi:hypothetical protein